VRDIAGDASTLRHVTGWRGFGIFHVIPSYSWSRLQSLNSLFCLVAPQTPFARDTSLKGNGMTRSISLLLLAVMLVCGGMGCAPKRIGPTQPSGYFFTLDVSDTQIYQLVNPTVYRSLPGIAHVYVRVQNAQGQPVNGVPVEFEVDPAWTRNASLIPQRAVTQGGTAHAVFQAQAIGVVRIVVRVEDRTQDVKIAVSSPPDMRKG
jgi:hypothetical protein